MTIPLNGSGITNKIDRALSGANMTQAHRPAHGLAAALAGEPHTPQLPDQEPVNGTDKISVLVRAGVPREKASSVAHLLQGDTEEELTQSAEKIASMFTTAVDGTGFGLGPSHKPVKVAATDPSQGRGNARPRVTEDPFMRAFQSMGIV